MREITIAIENTADLTAAMKAAARTDGVEIETITDETRPEGETRAMIGVVAGIAIAGAASVVASFLYKIFTTDRRGLVIDLRPGADPTVTRDAPEGYVITIPPEGGAVKIEVKDTPESEVERLLTLLLDKTIGSVADVVGAAKEALGEGVTIET